MMSSVRGRAQTGEKRGQRFGETQIGGAVGRLSAIDCNSARSLTRSDATSGMHGALIERKKVFLVAVSSARRSFADELIARAIVRDALSDRCACGLQPVRFELALDQAGPSGSLTSRSHSTRSRTLGDRAAAANRPPSRRQASEPDTM